MKSTLLDPLQLTPYYEAIDRTISEFLEKNPTPKKLNEACDYALNSGGKRFRPILVLMMARSINKGLDSSFAACAVEFFHTASLIADDLPCMDNDDLRRGRPSLHCVFGETTALLASYALIAGGYELIARNSIGFSSEVCRLALECAGKSTGIQGATGGQFLDIYPKDLSEVFVREVFEKKTGALFEMAFVFGWLFGGGDPSLLQQVKKVASHFGMAFQIADDLGDEDEDAKNGRKVNFVSCWGKERAFEVFHVELSSFYEGLDVLELGSSDLVLLGRDLEQKTVL